MDALTSFFTVIAGFVAGIVDAVIKRLAHEPHPESLPGIKGSIARWAQGHRAQSPQ
jgi:hypothetical protein